MSFLTLNCCFPQNVTIIPNEFLDRYLPHANGEFVKVYLLLLRMTSADRNFSMSDAADILSCTEKDIVRALRYWEKTGLIELTQSENGNVTGVTILYPRREDQNAVNNNESSGESIPASADPETETESLPAENDTVPRRKQISAARLSQLEDTEDFTYLLFVSGQYLGRNLTRTDIDTLGYFYDELHMSADLIEYLIEYCVGNNHKTIRYIETVGLAWHSEGIKTVQEAKDSSGRYNKDYYTIFKALGIRSHSPISAEIQIMDKWMNTYHFTMDVIQEACTRTILNTSKPTLTYADKILTRWFAENIHTLDDIKRDDEKHQQKQVKDRKAPKPAKGRTPSGSFYNFEQRSYDNNLENQLLGIPGNNNSDS